MNAIQLEFNIENESEQDVKFSYMQKQINELNDSLGKARRRLFAELNEMKKHFQELRNENEALRAKLHEKTEWIYGEGECLFSIKELERACG